MSVTIAVLSKNSYRPQYLSLLVLQIKRAWKNANGDVTSDHEKAGTVSMVPPSTCSIRRLYCIESSFSTRANEPRVRGSHIYVSYWTLCERSERADNKLDNDSSNLRRAMHVHDSSNYALLEEQVRRARSDDGRL